MEINIKDSPTAASKKATQNSEIIYLNKGWNLISCSFKCVVNDYNKIIKLNTLYEFNTSRPNTFIPVNVISPNQACWIKANESGEIMLNVV